MRDSSVAPQVVRKNMEHAEIKTAIKLCISPMSGYVFIVNPEAKNGTVGKTWGRVEQRANELDLDFQAVFTEYPGHAMELAVDTGSASDARIAVGGDGTFNEVANGVLEKGITVGMLPLGNGNDYARNFKFITNDPEGSVDALSSMKPIPVSAAKITGNEGSSRYFFNVMDAGLTADVAKAAHTAGKWLRGNAKYTYLAIKKLLRWKNRPATLTVDGKEIELEFTLVAAGLGKHFGAGYTPLPFAAPDNDYLDIVYAEGISRRKMPGLMKKLKIGLHIEEKGVHAITGKHLRIETKDPVCVEMEGEIVDTTPVDVTIEDRKLSFLVDPSSEIHARVQFGSQAKENAD